MPKRCASERCRFLASVLMVAGLHFDLLSLVFSACFANLISAINPTPFPILLDGASDLAWSTSCAAAIQPMCHNRAITGFRYDCIHEPFRLFQVACPHSLYPKNSFILAECGQMAAEICCCQPLIPAVLPKSIAIRRMSCLHFWSFFHVIIT